MMHCFLRRAETLNSWRRCFSVSSWFVHVCTIVKLRFSWYNCQGWRDGTRGLALAANCSTASSTSCFSRPVFSPVQRWNLEHLIFNGTYDIYCNLYNIITFYGTFQLLVHVFARCIMIIMHILYFDILFASTLLTCYDLSSKFHPLSLLDSLIRHRFWSVGPS